MDPATDKEVRTAFRNEYSKKASGEVKGFFGWLMRKADAIEEKVTAWEKEGSWKFPAFMFGSIIVPTYALLAGFLAVPLVTVGVIGTAVWTGLHTARVAEAATEKLLDRDMENGVLPTRYREEILQPQINALELKKSSLPAAGGATAEFAKAVEPTQAVIDTTPKPSAPAPGHNGPIC